MSRQRTKSIEKHSKSTENNNDLTSEKCPEMSQLMLEDKRYHEILKAENDSFFRIADLLSFQDKEKQCYFVRFSVVIDLIPL